MSNRLTQKELNTLLIEDLSDYITDQSDSQKKPVILDLKSPFNIRAKIYLFNCTSPRGGKKAGGRKADEFKSQLIIENQARGETGFLDDSDGTFIFLMGYADPLDSKQKGVYVLWDTECHRKFAYSANLQVKLDALLETSYEDVVSYKRKNGEEVILARREYLKEAIEKRLYTTMKNIIK